MTGPSAGKRRAVPVATAAGESPIRIIETCCRAQIPEVKLPLCGTVLNCGPTTGTRQSGDRGSMLTILAGGRLPDLAKDVDHGIPKR